MKTSWKLKRSVVMKITEHVIKKINEVKIKWKVFKAEILNQSKVREVL